MCGTVQRLRVKSNTLGTYYYAPIKANRNVSKTHDSEPYKAVSKLTFSDEEIKHGVEIYIKGFAKNKHVNLFKFTVSTNRKFYQNHKGNRL